MTGVGNAGAGLADEAGSGLGQQAAHSAGGAKSECTAEPWGQYGHKQR